jgi:hypothetical protein
MIETGRRVKSVSRVKWVVRVAGQTFVTPETVALVQAFPTLQNQLLFYLAYPRAILIRLPPMPEQIRIFCSRTEFPLVKSRVRRGRGQTRSHKKPMQQVLPKQSHFQIPSNRPSVKDWKITMMRQNGKFSKSSIQSLPWTYLLGAIALPASAIFALF